MCFDGQCPLQRYFEERGAALERTQSVCKLVIPHFHTPSLCSEESKGLQAAMKHLPEHGHV